jgi:Zinc dependent phospholipase C
VQISRKWPHNIAALLFFFLTVELSSGYSVLTHEEIVDLAWQDSIKPLLLAKYPSTTSEQLSEAHAYAYGGCVIQDMGYYPFGNKRFSDLVHYVRSGDFVENLINEAGDINEYAFALGALAHYAADISGHPAVNRAVPLEFPSLRKKFGNTVTYEQDPKAHIRTEFGFDVAQAAKKRYAPESYHDFIGFEVSKPLLERAFLKTYGIELKDLFKSLDLSIGTYRRSISTIIPEMTKVALLSKQNIAVQEKNNAAKKQFIYYLSRADYEREWGKQYERPGIGARILAFLFRLIPKFGPFKAINFKTPSTQTEDLYIKSVDLTVETYKQELETLKAGELHLPDVNFDTSERTRAGQYKLTDEAYADLLGKLADTHFDHVNPALRDNILQFYDNLNAPIETRRHKDKWERLQRQLTQLKDSTNANGTSGEPK